MLMGRVPTGALCSRLWLKRAPRHTIMHQLWGSQWLGTGLPATTGGPAPRRATFDRKEREPEVDAGQSFAGPCVHSLGRRACHDRQAGELHSTKHQTFRLTCPVNRAGPSLYFYQCKWWRSAHL